MKVNTTQRQEAYAAIKERFNLRAKQRDALDASPKLELILTLAHDTHWDFVEFLLQHEKIMSEE